MAIRPYKFMESIIPLDLSQAGLDRDASFLREVFPKAAHVTTEFLHWEYIQNPEGHAIGFNVFDGDLQIAHSVLQPLRVRWQGSEVRGVLSLNSATHPKHRRKGLYFSLCQKSYDKAADLGFEFVIGVANQLSTPGFISKVGFQLVCPLDVRLGVGSIAFKKITVAPSLEKIWDERGLVWRLHCPTLKYRSVSVQDRIFVYGSARNLGAEVFMGDFSCLPALDSFFQWRNPLRLWAGLDPNVDWKRSLFFPLPVRFRPSPLNLIFKDLTGKNRKLRAGTVKWNPIDFDTF